MAKYTELLSEYVLNGNPLPEIFGEIPAFETLFLMVYGDREIGFETEDIFRLKLEARAETIIPLYKFAIEKTSGITIEKIKTRTFKGGARRETDTALPINSTSALPSNVNNAESYTDTETETETGFTEAEFVYFYDFWLTRDELSIIKKALAEFDSLFMQVY